MGLTWEIREAKPEEWEMAMDLAWITFLRFEADEYTPEGVEKFWEFIHDETLKKMFLLGHYKVFVALCDGRIVGVISLRDKTHISLLFVEEMYHRKGIGSELIDVLKEYVETQINASFLSVNAAPFGVPFYIATGFIAQGPEVEQYGIRYTPMKMTFRKGVPNG